MIICDRTICTGCGLCFERCPSKAIEMKPDEYGFVHPVVDDKKCIKCGLCRKKCPSLNNIPGRTSNIAYAAFAKDDQIHMSSQSGGLAYLLEKKAIEEDSIVYGQAYDANLDLTWQRIEKTKDLWKLQMSKYVQGSIIGAYSKLLEDLKLDRSVLFVGTPCQVAAMLSYLPDKYKEHLTTASFVCGGVASPQNVKDRIDWLDSRRKIDKSQIDNITFRIIGGGYYFKFFHGDKVLYEEGNTFSDFLIAYGEHLNLRESCYHCRYARTDRIGDITIGDYLALGEHKSSLAENEFRNGVSLAIPTTLKGKRIFKACLTDMIYEKRTYEDASIHNKRLQHPSDRSPQVELYRKYYPRIGFADSVRKIYWKKYYWCGFFRHKAAQFVRLFVKHSR